MRRHLAAGTTIAAAALLLSAEASQLHAETSKKVVKMTGSFVRGPKGGQSHDLQAEFTRETGKEWAAVFTFNWGKTPHTYKGTATIGGGKMSGTVTTEDGKRKFGFAAATRGGKLTGTHHELHGKRENPTGSFELKADK